LDITNETVKLDYKRHEILICAKSHIEKESRAFSCKKEPDTVKWIESHFKKGDVALDIGANIGAYSLIMAKVMGGEGMVYAFEPGWPNFYHLNKNIILNKCQKNIMALNMALSSDKGVNIFNYRDLTFGSSLHTLNKPIDFVGNLFEPKICQLIISYSVDKFVNEFNIKPVNHIKLDVDGIEAEVIKGARGTLQNPKCRSIMVELNEDFKSDLKCIVFIQSCVFKNISKRPNPSEFYKSDTIYNYIFAKT
jgi:FkbM family methyltransferase